MENRIKISAPGKLMLFGEHAVVYKYPCLVMAVDKRMKVEIVKRKGKEIFISAPQLGLMEYRKKVEDLGKYEIPKTVRFIEVIVKNIFKQYDLTEGLEIKTSCDFSANFGFGSSAAVTVSVAYGILILFSIKVSKRELFDICYRSVLEVQGVGSGFDIAAAVYGGLLYFVGGGKIIEGLDVKKLPLVVGYTGVKADTPTIVRQVAEMKRKEPKKVEEIFIGIKNIVEKAKVAINKREYKELGKLMNRNHKLLKELGVSSVELDNLIEAAYRNGAYGAKLSGAGGGDCMIALRQAQDKYRIEEAIEKAGGEVIDVGLCSEGVRLEK